MTLIPCLTCPEAFAPPFGLWGFYVTRFPGADLTWNE